MENVASIVFLVLFAISTTLIYLAVRRQWLPPRVSGLVGAGANAVFMTLFSASRTPNFGYSLVVGLLLGLLFTGMTIVVAVYFNRNGDDLQRSRAAQPPQASVQDATRDEPRI